LIREASDRLHLSARGFHRILKLARTIADLDGATEVGRTHLAEALTYASIPQRNSGPRDSRQSASQEPTVMR